MSRNYLVFSIESKFLNNWHYFYIIKKMRVYKIVIALILICNILNIEAQTISIDEIRREYSKAMENQALCEKWYARIQNDNSTNNKLKAYKGGICMAMARFAPITKKMAYIAQGKKLVEEAISNSKEDVEIRFIRYGLQINLPAIVSYNKNKVEDRNFINTHIDKLPNDAMKLAVKKYMEETKNK